VVTGFAQTRANKEIKRWSGSLLAATRFRSSKPVNIWPGRTRFPASGNVWFKWSGKRRIGALNTRSEKERLAHE